MRSYTRAYAALNKEQRLAVDTIDGPLLVIAGPGTGKTQLLSTRVAHILKETDADASNILCLTFTNKASDTMKQRMLQLIGSDAERIYVKTFHGFAAEVMNRYPQYFWSGARLSIAPEAVQLEVVQTVLNRLPVDHIMSLKFAGQFTLIKDVQSAINLAKEAGLTPEKLRALINANLAYIDTVEPSLARVGDVRVSKKTVPSIEMIITGLPNQTIEYLVYPFVPLDVVLSESLRSAVETATESGKLTEISRWKRRWIQPIDGGYGLVNERARNEWWLGVADAYEQYRTQLHTRGYYDYADMLVEVIGQMEQNPSLRSELQEQFQYVLIDEFQDTNAAQLRMSHLLADNQTSNGNPNIMAVGDDDQSIFKFQGAELSNMLRFSKDYPRGKTIVLTKNYRSTQAILDSANSIISHADYRLVKAVPGLSKHLISEVSPQKSRIEHVRHRSREEQLTGIALEAGTLLSNGKSVAILARSHTSLRDIAHILLQRAIPIRYEQSNDIFEREAVIQIMDLLRLLVAVKNGESQNASALLSKILRHPMWRLDPKLLWEFALQQQSTADWYSGLLKHQNKQFRQIGQWISELVGLSSTEPASVICEYLVGLRPGNTLTSPLKQFYLDQKDITQEYLETLSAIQLFRVMAAEFSTAQRATVDDFVMLVDLLQQNDKILADTTPFQNGNTFVELLTVHKAKGQEFDCVIIIDATATEWSPSTRGRTPPANLPLRPAEDDADDYARLMYVAATRARQTLLVSSYEYSLKGESVLASPIVDKLPIKTAKPLKGKQLIQTLEETLAWPRLSQTNEQELLKTRLETYSMSVTHLINFLDVTSGGPQHFFERNLLRLPDAKSPSAALGSAVHSALQLAQNLTNQKQFKLSTIMIHFETALRSEGLPHADFEKQLKRGERLLKYLFEQLQFRPSEGGKPEFAIADVRCGSALLNGKLDVLWQDDKITLITDYKTGRALASLQLKSGEQGIKAWKHRLQLTYYALLAQLEPHLAHNTTVTSQMLYLEAKTQKELMRSYVPTPDEITELSSLLQIVWSHIMNLDFPKTSNYPETIKGIEAFQQDLLSKKI